LGLAPIFLFWNIKAPKMSFHLAIFAGIFIGIIHTLGWFPDSLVFTEGKYANLLAANVWGTVICFAAYFIPIVLIKRK